MKRNEHLFHFTGKAISNAAEECYLYHLSRLKYWRERQITAKNKAENAGISVKEHVVTGGYNYSLEVDSSITTELNLCRSKIEKHLSLADKYKIETVAYNTQPDTLFELHPDDIVYFRLVSNCLREE